DDRLFASVEVNAIDLVLRFIADVEETGRIPDRPLGETEPGGNCRELRIVIQEFPELRRLSDQLEFPRRLTRALGRPQRRRTLDRSHKQHFACDSRDPFHWSSSSPV